MTTDPWTRETPSAPVHRSGTDLVASFAAFLGTLVLIVLVVRLLVMPRLSDPVTLTSAQLEAVLIGGLGAAAFAVFALTQLVAVALYARARRARNQGRR